MTISTQASQVTLLGNGATTVFNFPFVGAAASDIQVTYTDANSNQTILPSSVYTLVLNPPSAGQLWGIGGTVTYPTSGSAIANGTSLTISRIVPLTQTVTISNQGDFAPQVIEQAMDLLELQIQQVSARTGKLRGTWATDIVYNFGDVVVDGANGANTGNFYMCAIQNTSGTWSTDFAAGDWVIAYIGLTAANIAAVLGYTPMNGADNLSEILNAATARGHLGLGTMATQNANGVGITGGTISGVTLTGHASLDLAIANNLSDLNSAPGARTNLGLVIGTNVQAFSSVLLQWAGIAPPGGAVVGTSDTQTLFNKTLQSPSIDSPIVTTTLTTQGGVVRTVRIATTPGGVAVGTSDDIVIVNKTVGGATNVQLNISPTIGQTYVIKDGRGDAATNNIIISPLGKNIDGASTFVMNKNYQSATVSYNGTQWNVIAN